ncbi:MAG: hybrid sensor histidine kinase/response regulator [Piscirickettsiaceae bacterium]|nr:MAG: hybrid sensor histidine kinase/response regulator [Piscirickettsiaceae bacterium]
MGVLPAAILAIILAVYFTNSRLMEVKELFEEKEKNLAIAVAKSSVYGVFSGDTQLLTNIINSVIVDPDVLSIEITDNKNKQLVHITKNNQKTPLKDIIETTQTIEIEPAANDDEMGDVFFGSITKTNIIGHLTIRSSINGIKKRQSEILLNSSYITLFSLLIIAFIAHRIGKTIGQPILSLSEDVIKIKKGQYKLPERTFTNQDEISLLSQGIRDMAHELETNQFQQQRKIHDATRELERQNLQLLTAHKKITKISDAKSTFVSHISHEIRTPLNGIIGFLDIIEQTPLTDEQQKLVQASITSSKNLHQIINDVLDLAQLEAGKVRINKTNFPLKSTIQDSLTTLTIQASNNNVIIDLNYDESLPAVIHQDPIKLNQIILNLVGNAIKFSPNSTVTVKVQPHAEYSKKIDICVIDHGIGISEDNLSELFKEFTQFDVTTFDKGSGLGLAITQNIISALNGTLHVNSTLGQGTTFQFYLPYTSVKDSYSTINQNSTSSPILSDLTGINILAADDNDINRLLLTHLLEKQKAIVHCVNDGQQALDAASQKKYDLLLFDLRMPYKHGHEVLRDIRIDEQHVNYSTPAIAITAHVTSGIERANHINNFDGYLVKPIDRLELLNLVQQLLDNELTPFSIPAAAPPTSIPALQTFDLKAALTSMGNDIVLVEQMINKFIANLPAQLKTFKDELANDNNDTAADIVHQIHGSAAYCGTTLLKSSAKILEEALRDSSSNINDETISDFIHQAERLIAMEKDILSIIKESPN